MGTNQKKLIYPFLKIVVLLLLLLVVVYLPKRSLASFSQTERQIIVFRQDFSDFDRNQLLSKLKITPFKNLPLINARLAWLSADQVSLLRQDRRILRIDPDVQVYALSVSTDEIFSSWTWPSRRKPTPTPTFKPSPTPTPTPTLTVTPSPTSTPTPDLTLTPTATATPTPGTTLQPLPWGIARIKADQAWLSSRGSQVKVAVIDTGVDRDHPDLNDNLAGCVNFIYSWKTCEDDNGHGTHVTGIIAAEDNSFGVVGVAPQAKIYSLKVLDSRGSGYLSDIIEALDWVITNKMNVVNMSLGTSTDVASFREAVAKVEAAGIVQVAAAGNSGPSSNSVNYPAAYPEVIAVSATDQNDAVPSWSSRGQEVDLAGPGVGIYSTYKGNGYQTLSGTSMSSPHVAAVVALRKAIFPQESPLEIREILKNNADLLPFDPTLVGSGLVNANKVVTAP